MVSCQKVRSNLTAGWFGQPFQEETVLLGNGVYRMGLPY